MSKIKEPHHHHSTLNAFASVVNLLEGGVIHDPDAENETAKKIIALCQKEIYRQLRRFDEAKRRESAK